jgi:hypothetical protein
MNSEPSALASNVNYPLSKRQVTNSPLLVEPELHIIGEIKGCELYSHNDALTPTSNSLFSGLNILSDWIFSAAHSFSLSSDLFSSLSTNAFAGFEIKKGRQWRLVGGKDRGQTQVDYPQVSLYLIIELNHPTNSLPFYHSIFYSYSLFLLIYSLHLTSHRFGVLNADFLSFFDLYPISDIRYPFSSILSFLLILIDFFSFFSLYYPF